MAATCSQRDSFAICFVRQVCATGSKMQKRQLLRIHKPQSVCSVLFSATGQTVQGRPPTGSCPICSDDGFANELPA